MKIKEGENVFGKDEILKYPFLADLKSCIPEGIPVNSPTEFVKQMPEMKKLAYERLLETFSDDEPTEVKPAESYLLAVVIMKLVNEPLLVKKFSLNEAIRAENSIKNTLGITVGKIINDRDWNLVNSAFHVQFKQNGLYTMIPIEKYLKLSGEFNSVYWSLVNQIVNDGYVYVFTEKAVRLLRSLMADKIKNQIDKTRVGRRMSIFDDEVSKLRTEVNKLKPRPPKLGKLPPCIRKAIEKLKQGENLSNDGRVMLGCYFLSYGKTVDEIAEFFKTAPDYSEKTTKYHLTQLERNGYNCAGCNKLDLSNLCYRDEECGNILHPMQFRGDING